MSTVMLVDGQNLFMRALFAARNSMTSTQGVVTGPLVIFINSLAKHIREENPDRLLVLWDGGTSAARRERLPSYKAARRPVTDDEKASRDSSGDLVRRFCALAGVPMFQLGGVEADDLIAGAWATVEDVEKILILSSDGDFLQLLGTNPHGVRTEQVRLSSFGTATDRWNENRVWNDKGYAPTYWPLVTALAGDTTDGVPGLPGVGQKRAVKLLEAHKWDLDEVLAAKVESERELVRACRFCVDLRGGGMTLAPVVVPRWRPTWQDSQTWGRLTEFLAVYELRDILDRLRAGELWFDRPPLSAWPLDVEAQ